MTIPQAGDPLTLSIMQRTFARLGVTWTLDEETLIVPQQSERRVVEDIANSTPKIEDGIWPAFPSDLMSIAIVLATQTAGTTLFFEKMFESRMYFVDHLMSMGANIFPAIRIEWWSSVLLSCVVARSPVPILERVWRCLSPPVVRMERARLRMQR